MSHKSSQLFMIVSLLIATTVSAPGQVPSRVESSPESVWSGRPVVTATVSNDQVRLTALALTHGIRLEVLSRTGEPVYDSGLQPGNRIEWAVIDQQGSGLRDGTYGCLVTVADLSGQVNQRRAVFSVTDGAVSFDTTHRQAVAAASNEQESLTILWADEDSPFVLVSHNGKEGWVESASGGLSFYTGSLSRSSGSVPHLRLTPEGSVGIGVTEPQAKLDVAGLIRTQGIIFPDGTIQRTAARGVSLFTVGQTTGGTVLGLGDSVSSVAGRALSGSAGSGGRTLARNESPARVFGDEGSYNTYYGSGSGDFLNEAGGGTKNSFFGASSGANTTTGDSNSMFGHLAGVRNITGRHNSFFGAMAGYNGTTTDANSFFGSWAGYNNATGYYNSFFGREAGLGNTSGSDNAIFGATAGKYNTEGSDNSFFGRNAGNHNITGQYNSFFGSSAGLNNSTAYGNSFFGYFAGRANTTGFGNAFFGASAGPSATTANYNSFFGSNAGYNTTTGADNSFFGRSAGYANTVGNANSFLGKNAGQANTTGGANSFVGNNAGYSNISGYENSFIGADSGYNNTTGFLNSFVGRNAGAANTIGNYNAFVGHGAGFGNTRGNSNTFVGHAAGIANTTGSSNSFVGDWAGASNTTENNNIFIGTNSDGAAGITNATAIGYLAKVSQSNSLVLGSINGINGATADTNVGIGTTSPDRQLVIEGSQALARFTRFKHTSDTLAPTFAPAFLFERARGTQAAPADIIGGDYLGKMQFRGRVGGNMLEYGALTFISTDINQNGRLAFVDRDMLTERVSFLNSGNVGIGTTNPTERLQVVGNLKVSGSILYGAPATEVPDYVFGTGYKLMPIQELEKFISQEKHLPNVPDSAEIKKEGLNLGEFQMKLLEKIEELTLYTVQQAKVISQKDADIAALKSQKDAEVAALRSQNATLDARLAVLEQMVERLAKER